MGNLTETLKNTQSSCLIIMVILGYIIMVRTIFLGAVTKVLYDKGADDDAIQSSENKFMDSKVSFICALIMIFGLPRITNAFYQAAEARGMNLEVSKDAATVSFDTASVLFNFIKYGGFACIGIGGLFIIGAVFEYVFANSAHKDINEIKSLIKNGAILAFKGFAIGAFIFLLNCIYD